MKNNIYIVLELNKIFRYSLNSMLFTFMFIECVIDIVLFKYGAQKNLSHCFANKEI